MKFILLFAAVALSLGNTQTNPELLGKWVPVHAENEDGVPCAANITESFWIEFLPEAQFVMEEYSWGDAGSMRSNGDYDLTNDLLTLNYKVTGFEAKMKLPILEWSEDKLVLNHCLCPTQDSIAPVILELKRLRQ
jgi:hypothetical protein